MFLHLFNKEKQIRLIGLLVYIFLACAFVLWFKPYYFFSILIVLVPPSLINFLWLKKSKGKIVLFSLAATLIFAPPVELALRMVNAWDVQSIFYRPFGLIPLENMLFAFLNFFWVLAFYEYFVDRETKCISKRFKYLVDLFIVFATVVFGLFAYSPDLLKTSYIGMSVIILIVPAFLIFWQNPHLLKKSILPTVFFAIVFFVYELVSIKIGSWWWPGEYIWPIKVFGEVFPIDDVVIWYLLSTPALIGGYEYFADDDC